MKFELSEHITPELVRLLEETDLGTNGAIYRHLDVKDRIYQTDHPLCFSFKRADHLLANITFCRREFGLYLRHFAFDKRFQSKGKARNPKDNSVLKQEIESVFQQVEKNYAGSLKMCYAYIDSRNIRSKWMSEQFGFVTKAKLVTQTYSRFYPKKLTNLKKEKIQAEHLDWIRANYGQHVAYFEEFVHQGELHCWRSDKGELLALGKFTHVTWKISRLPGKFGAILVKALPFIPFLRKIIHVKQQKFLVPEVICLRDEKATTLMSFLSGVLAMEGRHVMLWCMDEQEPLYLKTNPQMNWGLMHRFLGISTVDVVFRGSFEPKNPIFVAAYDII